MAEAINPFEPLAFGHTWLHRRDPRAKLLLAAGFSLLVAVGQGWAMLVSALVMGIITVAASRPPLGPVFKRLVAVNVFIAFLWVMLPVSITSGPEGWSLGWDRAGVILALTVTLKANAIVLVLLGLVATTPVVRLLHALHHLRLSDKLVHLFMFFFRYIHVFNQEYHRLRMAMRVRAFRPGTNLHTYRATANLVGMLLVRSYDRAERVYQAMLCRGFSGTYWVLEHFEWGPRDTALSLTGVAALIGLGLAWGLLK